MGSNYSPCIKCKGENIEKLLSPPSIIFRGSGFYKTDNAVKELKHADKATEKPASHTKNVEEKTSKNGQHKPNTIMEKGVAKHDTTT